MSARQGDGCNKGYPTKYKFQLKVRNVGTYTSKTLAGLVWEVVKHRWYHFKRGDGWVD